MQTGKKAPGFVVDETKGGTMKDSRPAVPDAAGGQEIDPADLVQFEIAARRTLRRHIDLSFIRTHRPVLDEGPSRSFDTMAEYREWCERELPDWLGYGRD